MDYEKRTHSSGGIFYRQYNGETDLKYIMSLVQNELSEPYVVYTYRYFLQGWPNLSFLAFPEATDGIGHSDKPIGVIVCKQSIHKGEARRGYIAMLSVDREWRKRGVASNLVKLSIDMMTQTGADELGSWTGYPDMSPPLFIARPNLELLLTTLPQIVLETEVDNVPALGLYASLGFIREKRLYRFYMNGKDAFRLVLPVIPEESGPSVEITISSTAPISVPTHIKFPKDAPQMATLETPPSPLYPIHGHRAALPETSIDDSAASSFSMGGILSAASPHSAGSTDSFVVYGAHIPSSISPPLPPRPAHSATNSPRRSREDDDSYISGR